MTSLILGGRGFYLTEDRSHKMEWNGKEWEFYLNGRYAGALPGRRASLAAMNRLLTLNERYPNHKWELSSRSGTTFQCSQCGIYGDFNLFGGCQ